MRMVAMIAYAARTSNARSLAALRGAGWRVLLSPATGLNSYGLPYALDNGAWTAFKAGTPFDGDKFRDAVDAIGEGADFVAVPDIVEGGLDSLARSIEWLSWVMARTPRPLIPVQDGMQVADVAPLLTDRVGIFVGGSTAFKERTMATWADLARAKLTICHVGRVNTVRRIALCAAAGATSFDGSSVSRYAKNLPKLDLARHQPDLLLDKGAR